jgi:hypothetical protein
LGSDDLSSLPLSPGDEWPQVAQRVLSHDFRYKASLQFVWRKIPGLKQAVMYRIHRDLAGEDLSRWLAHKTGTGGGALRAAA